MIERELGIHLSITCVGNYLRRWGFTCQRPKLTATEQNPEKVRQWLEDEYPAIRAQAKAEGAEIWWGDETAVQNTLISCEAFLHGENAYSQIVWEANSSHDGFRCQ
ncbi:MAG: winged helix-turn-helix domain-containing protein [Fibrobacteres bacterium]|nr:winged helix-turn-helix domain-containing protein [Fibrobacterota bacterium]